MSLAGKLDRSMQALREDLVADSTRGLHLIAQLLARRSETRVVLVVDQVEELFTLTTSEVERQQFIELVLTAITEPRGPLLALLTLRADFFDRPLAYPALGALLETHGKVVLPMTLTELREAVEQPAALPDVQLTFEPGLVGDLLFEVAGQAGALPLLEFTLAQLFARRQGHTLTVAAYREIGGVRGALTTQAEATFATLPSEEHRQLARALFLRLIDSGTTEQDTTRRRAAWNELTLPDARRTALLRTVVERLRRGEAADHERTRRPRHARSEPAKPDRRVGTPIGLAARGPRRHPVAADDRCGRGKLGPAGSAG